MMNPYLAWLTASRSWLAFSFWASPHDTIGRMLAMSGDRFAERAALNALMPGFPVDLPAEKPEQKPTEKPTEQPARPIPTDVPQPQPLDVPVPEPRDVPVPDPGTEPSPSKPPPAREDPKPRSVP